MFKILGADQKEYGPVSAEQVKEWILQSRANAQTRVQAVGTTEWKPLAEFPEFAEALGQGARPRPTGPVPSAPALPVTPSAAQPTSGLAITSLVLGILGLFSCGLTALVGLVLGIVAMVKIERSNGRLGGKGIALAGTITSGVFLLMIPIFAALLLPAMARVKQKADTIRCINNVRQLSVGLILYTDTNNGQLPAGDKWCEAVKPHVGSDTNVFFCIRGTTVQQAHYAFNARLAGTDIKSVSSPGTTVLVFEGQGGWDSSGGKELLPSAPRHNGVYVVGFVDGHVESVRAERLSRLRWEP